MLVGRGCLSVSGERVSSVGGERVCVSGERVSKC